MGVRLTQTVQGDDGEAFCDFLNQSFGVQPHLEQLVTPSGSKTDWYFVVVPQKWEKRANDMYAAWTAGRRSR